MLNIDLDKTVFAPFLTKISNVTGEFASTTSIGNTETSVPLAFTKSASAKVAIALILSVSNTGAALSVL